MRLSLQIQHTEYVAVIRCQGRIVSGAEIAALQSEIDDASHAKKRIVLHLADVTFIDSAGLGTLVAAHHSAKGQGAALKLCHLGTKFQEVLQITKLMTIFDVYNTEAEAVSSFSK